MLIIQIPTLNRGKLLSIYQVEAMMSCTLPLPIPLPLQALHADYPPVHIGVKVSHGFQ